MSKEENKGVFRWLLSFFAHYVWVGIVLVLLAICVDLCNPHADFKVAMTGRFLESIGIAILIAAIFSYISGTNEFVEKIRDLLKSIIIDRSFLGNIDQNSKKSALHALLRPTTKEQQIYSNLLYYYNSQVEQMLSVTSKCVRSNYHLNVYVLNDPERQCLRIEQTVRYRLYPTVDGFEEIKVGFYEFQEDAKPECLSLIVSSPDGTRSKYEPFVLKDDENGGRLTRYGTLDLKEFGGKFAHLDIEIRLLEFAKKDVALVAFTALQPTDGLIVCVECEEGLGIDDVVTFLHNSEAYIDKRGINSVTVGSSKWLNEGSGVCVLVHRGMTKK